jgi:hypothetical protein
MGKDENGAKLPAWFLFLCIPSVFYQFFSSNVIYLTIPKATTVYFVLSLLFRPGKIQYFNLKILGHSILKNLFFIEKNALNLGLNRVQRITARPDVGI